MGVEKVYHVVTEFQFEIQDAVANSKTLQGALGKISGAADAALFSVTSLSKYLMSGLGVNLTLFGAVTKSLMASEKLFSAQTSFANLLGGNIENLQGDVGTFNDRLQVSKQILGDIAKQARKFGLDEGNLLNTTKMTAAMLIPKGLAGNNLGNAIDMARMFEKSSPLLGVDTFESQGQLVRMLEGNASMQDTLFRRLLSETKSFSDLRGRPGAAKTFNLLPAEQRFKKFMDGLRQFSSDADVNARMADLLANKWRTLTNILFGLNGIMIPIGETVKKFLGGALDQLIARIEVDGPKFVKMFNSVIKDVLGNPGKTYENLKQLSALQKDVAKAGKVSGFIGLVSFLSFIGRTATKYTGINLTLGALFKTILKFVGIGGAVGGVGGGFILITNAARIMGIAFFALRFIMFRLFAPLAVFTTFFQILSRAMAKADIKNLKFVADNVGGVSTSLTRLYNATKKVIAPWMLFVDAMADFIAPLFELDLYGGLLTTGLETLAGWMEWLGDKSIWLAGVAMGTFQTTFKLVDDYINLTVGAWMSIFNVTKLVFGEIITMAGNALNALKSGNLVGVKDAFSSGFDAIGSGMGQALSPMKNAWADVGGYGDIYSKAIADMNQRYVASINGADGEKNVSNRVTNIGKVEINNDFKENMEPDRIAHSLVKTILDAAKNPLQGAGNSLQGAFVGGN